MKKVILLLIIILLVNSCSWIKRKPVIVTESRVIPITAPEIMFKGCEIPSPPDKDSYIKGDLNYRLGTMLRYNTQLVKTISECQHRIEALRKWQIKQAKVLRTDVETKK